MIEKLIAVIVRIQETLPCGLNDILAKMSPEDDELNEYEWLQEQLSNLLVELWQICNPANEMIRAHDERPRPTIVCLCGSTRFYEAFQQANFEETMKGKIVLSVGFYPHSSTQAHGQEIGITPEQKERLDRLHLGKIDMADEVLILNVGGYIGESTARELQHALETGKRVRFLEGHFDEIGPKTPEEADETLREAGYDPDEVSAQMKAAAEQAMANSPFNWHNRAQKELADVRLDSESATNDRPASGKGSEIVID